MSRRLTAIDIATAADLSQIHPALIEAVLAVETGGRGGFLPDGRPRILFEAHIFSRLTARRFDAGYPAISSPTWNRDLYRGGAVEHERLGQAIALNRPAALKSASWGLFQILGLNHRQAGFRDVQEFVIAHETDELEHLKAFLNFVETKGLIRPLRERNWQAFARGYNGPGFAKNRYDVKLAEAYAAALSRRGSR